MLTPGLVFAADGAAVRPRDRGRRAGRTSKSWSPRNPPTGRRDDAFRRARWTPADRRRRCGARRRSAPTRSPSSCSPPARPGMPKGVINTQRMLCANQADDPRGAARSSPRSRRCWSTGCRGTTPSAATTTSASCSTTAARSTSTRASRCPARSSETVRNLREIAPTVYFNVPKGFEMLLPHLARRRGRCAQPSSAGSRCSSSPAPACRSRSGTSSERSPSRPRGERIVMLTGLGMTETAPFAICCSWDTERSPAISACRRRASSSSWCPREARSKRAQGPERHARLLARAGAHRATPSTRKASTASATRSSSPIRREPAKGLAVRRPHRRGLQARHRHLGQRRAAARDDHRRRRAARAGRGDRRHRPRRRRRAGLPRPRCLPQACARLPADAPAARRARATPQRARLLPAAARRAGGAGTGSVRPRRPRASCSPSRPRSTSARPPTRARSTSARCSRHRAALVEELYADPPPASVIVAGRSSMAAAQGS